MNYKTEQEKFWATDFGNDYPSRNEGEKLISSNIALFAKIFQSCPNVHSVAELGCNIGLNLIALNRLNKNINLRGYEINEKAAISAREEKVAEIINTTVVEPLDIGKKFDLTFTKGVLIHINPDMLPAVYQNLYDLSTRYIMVCEYYNPSPVSVEYRGNKERLFKRDFAGELMQKYRLKLINYGFNYQHDPYLTNDDSTWFLLKKE
ncbi:MAG: pseudaminic acid biosynthesis-associated methylase [Crocinitomicaceae bacterium]|nr:pseudaminic acid biosynthesis-associated methylase [Crocinitomicaceae bacterium]